MGVSEEFFKRCSYRNQARYAAMYRLSLLPPKHSSNLLNLPNKLNGYATRTFGQKFGRGSSERVYFATCTSFEVWR